MRELPPENDLVFQAVLCVCRRAVGHVSPILLQTKQERQTRRA